MLSYDHTLNIETLLWRPCAAFFTGTPGGYGYHGHPTARKKLVFEFFFSVTIAVIIC